MVRGKAIPDSKQEEKVLPAAGMEEKEIPSTEQEGKEVPDAGVQENTVVIGGEKVEIKPTLLKYMRNRTAEFYRIIEVYPLPDILATKRGVQDEKRDGDKCLLDWLVAVTDDEELIREHYDELTAEDIMRMLEIFKRINRITEKEEAAKNRVTTGKVV